MQTIDDILERGIDEPPIYSGALTTSSDFDATGKTAAKIISFRRLPTGWHYGEGAAPRMAIIDMAEDVYWFLQAVGLDETDAFPGIHGEVMVTAYRGGHYLEIIIETDKTVTILYERDDQETFFAERLEGSLAFSAIEKVAEKIGAGELWNMSDFYTKTTLTRTQAKAASKASLSVILPTAAELPSSSEFASMLAGEAYVDMQDDFTRHAQQVTHQFFGNLTSPF